MNTLFKSMIGSFVTHSFVLIIVLQVISILLGSLVFLSVRLLVVYRF